MLRIKRNDLVEVVAGDDKGKRGRVVRVIPARAQVVVQGLNLQHRHVRRSQKNPQGGRIRREAPIHISNVMVIDPVSDKPARLGVRVVDGGKIRCARPGGHAIDKG